MTVNKSYACLKDIEHPLLILYGGSASGKSYYIAQRIITRIIQPTNTRNFLIIRKVQKTIKDSVFALIKNIISTMGLTDYFEINKTDYTLTTKSGYKILCKGLDDPEKIKSITVEKGLITNIWIEEATELNETDFNQLQLRLRGETQERKQVIMTFNPISNLHWIKKRFFDRQDPDVYIYKTTYKDNSFLSEDDRKNIEKLKEVDRVYYSVYALGEWGVLGNVVYNNWSIDNLDEIRDQFNTYYYGLDFGFTNDPTAFLKVAFKDNTIYILDEHYQKQLTNDKIADMLKEKGVETYIYCDSAEPKSIRELQNYGIQALPVKKGKDSVMHGIQWIRQQKIVIDRRCQSFINEIQSYKYREDKDGNVLNQPVDSNNHLLDALRYSLESYMSQTFIRDVELNASYFGL